MGLEQVTRRAGLAGDRVDEGKRAKTKINVVVSLEFT